MKSSALIIQLYKVTVCISVYHKFMPIYITEQLKVFIRLILSFISHFTEDVFAL